MAKILNEWLSELERLDAEATKDWDSDAFVSSARTELPRAVRVIKLMLEEQCRATECTEDLKALNAKIEKILNEGGGE